MPDEEQAAIEPPSGPYPQYLDRDVEKRLAVLQLAHDTHSNAADVVARAGEYLSFLDGTSKA